MELMDVINKISVVYRAECAKKRDLQDKIFEINKEFIDANEHDWMNISVARRDKLNREKDRLNDKVKIHTARAEGMHDVREIFIEMIGSEVE